MLAKQHRRQQRQQSLRNILLWHQALFPGSHLHGFLRAAHLCICQDSLLWSPASHAYLVFFARATRIPHSVRAHEAAEPDLSSAPGEASWSSLDDQCWQLHSLAPWEETQVLLVQQVLPKSATASGRVTSPPACHRLAAQPPLKGGRTPPLCCSSHLSHFPLPAQDQNAAQTFKPVLSEEISGLVNVKPCE